MPKQQKNATRKDDRVQVRVMTGVDPKTGKKKYKSFYGKSTAEAQAKAGAFRRDLENGYNVSAGNMVFEKWADRWLETYKPQVSYGTRENYKYAISLINEFIGTK